MKLLQSAFVLCTLVCCLARAEEPKDKCGCSKPKPTPPAQVMKPVAAPQRTACAPECAKPGQKACEVKPKA